MIQDTQRMTAATPLPLDRPEHSGLFCRYQNQPLESLLNDDQVLFAVGYQNPLGSFGQGVNPDDSGGQTLCGAKYVFSGLLPFPDSSGHRSPAPTEVWYSHKPVVSGHCGEIRWSCNDDYLFACIEWEECDGPELLQKSFAVYSRMLNFIRQRDYSHLIRVWNYLADINQGEGDNERYRQFCEGRYQAFFDCGYLPEDFPAASGLGHHFGHNLIYLIASRRPGRHFENPQQISAYRYPREYGRRSPSFARATVTLGDSHETVFISGTASIVGHQTRHPENCGMQLEVTLRNIETLLDHIGTRTQAPVTPDLLKVYVRHPQHLELIKHRVSKYMGEKVQTLYLHGDICRKELLVEIEGVYLRPQGRKPADNPCLL